MPDFRRRNTRRAQELRNDATPAEKALWHLVQGRKLGGYKFSRQIPIGAYFGDFVCRRLKLVLEIDGESHDFTGEEDERRTTEMVERGYGVLRFTNEEVLHNGDGVIAVIAEALANRPTPAAARLSPPACGRGDKRSPS